MTDVDSLDGLRALVAETEAAGTAEARWRAVAAVAQHPQRGGGRSIRWLFSWRCAAGGRCWNGCQSGSWHGRGLPNH